MKRTKEFTLRDMSQTAGLMVRFADYFNRFPKGEAPALKITIGEQTRTGLQNSLIHALFQQCADKTVLYDKNKRPYKKDKDWWKEEIKLKIGMKQVHFDLEENSTFIVVSTTEYSKREINDFVILLQKYMKETFKVDIDIREVQESLTKKR